MSAATFILLAGAAILVGWRCGRALGTLIVRVLLRWLTGGRR